MIKDYWDRAEFPWALVPKLAGLGIVGSTIEGYGCPGLSRLAAGMVTVEISHSFRDATRVLTATRVR